MSEFKNGDVVVMKSGGPRMTIRSVFTSTGSVDCIWSNGEQVFCYHFPDICLEYPKTVAIEEVKHEPEQETEVKRGPGRPRGQGRTDL